MLEISGDKGAAIRDILGGWLELLTLSTVPHLGMYINEDGKDQRLPENIRATAVAELYRPGFSRGDSIVGNAVIVSADDMGEECDVSEESVETIREFWDKLGFWKS
ncbi:hypothetical protein AN220_00700 [Streptomyces nanshensis]|nr:hypothetical protein AN220_00700 [Streptomyces nanshensis]